MKKQIVVIGLGRFGTSLATTLSDIGHDVLAVDKDEKKIQDVATQITHAVQADATSETILKELGISNFDIAIVAIGSAIESSVLSTILLKKLGVQNIIARATNEPHGSILEKIGADTVVYAEREMGARVARLATFSNILDYMPVIQEYGITKMVAPASFVGKVLSEIGFGPQGKREVGVLLIQRQKVAIVTPGQNEKVRNNDILILAGKDENLEKLLTEANNKTDS